MSDISLTESSGSLEEVSNGDDQEEAENQQLEGIQELVSFQVRVPFFEIKLNDNASSNQYNMFI